MECRISDVKALSQLSVTLPAGLSKGKLGTPKCRGTHFPALAGKSQWSLGRLKRRLSTSGCSQEFNACFVPVKTGFVHYNSTMLTGSFHAINNMVSLIPWCQTHLSGLDLLTINFVFMEDEYFFAIFQDFQGYFFVLSANLHTMVYACVHA